MIRVTYKYSDSFNYENEIYENYKIENDCIFLYGTLVNDNDLILINKIIKIEKQVKDLTLEECLKLKLYHIRLFQECIDIYVADEETSLYYDDYIDITDLIKEQGK